MSENDEAGFAAGTIAAAPLLYVQDPQYVNETATPPEPWCLSCGVRVARAGLPMHTRFHGWRPDNYLVGTHRELRERGVEL